MILSSITPRMSSARTRAPRGASLLELMVSLVLLAVVLGVTVGLVSGALRSGTRGRVRGELARQGESLNMMMGRELRLAGMGVPCCFTTTPADAAERAMAPGRHITEAYGTAVDTRFDARVILATATAVGIVADLPRPDAQYPTFGILNDNPLGASTRVMWHTENNGACAPFKTRAGAWACSTENTSVFFPGATGCWGGAAAADLTHRTCPWGLKRARAGERLQVVTGSLRWATVQVSSPLTLVDYLIPDAAPDDTSDNMRAYGLALVAPGWDSTVWPNLLPGDPPGATNGQGFVTTIDRVFYYLDAKRVYRIQCYGDPDPQHANWPDTNTWPVTVANLELTPAGGQKNTCVGPEVIATNVASLTFSYSGEGNVDIPLPMGSRAINAKIRGISWTATFEKAVFGRPVRQDVVGFVALRNVPAREVNDFNFNP